MSTCEQRGGEPEIIPGQEARHRLAQRAVMERHAAILAAEQAQKKSPKKSQKKQSRRRKMGGSGLETAVVPFGLLAVQQWFGTRNRNKSIKANALKNKKIVKNKSKKNRK